MVTFELENAHLAGGYWTTGMSKRGAQGRVWVSHKIKVIKTPYKLMMMSAIGEVDSKTPFVSVRQDSFQGNLISNLFKHQLPCSVSLDTVQHFSLIP